MSTGTGYVVGVSLKMYFSHARTLEWCAAVSALAADHAAVTSGAVDLVVLPSFPALVPAREVLGPAVRLGAQDIASEDVGAFTGEVSGTELADIGCSYAEMGHAERRRLFGDDDVTVSAKIAAALRNGLTPLLCVGEGTRTDPAEAAGTVAEELARLLAPLRGTGLAGEVVVAYEPHWAIGKPEPAPAVHISAVCRRLQAELDDDGSFHGAVIYGGSAGPGLLTALDGAVRGLFLGRFAHDPSALARILDEIDVDRTS